MVFFRARMNGGFWEHPVIQDFLGGWLRAGVKSLEKGGLFQFVGNGLKFGEFLRQFNQFLGWAGLAAIGIGLPRRIGGERGSGR